MVITRKIDLKSHKIALFKGVFALNLPQNGLKSSKMGQKCLNCLENASKTLNVLKKGCFWQGFAQKYSILAIKSVKYAFSP